MSDNNDGRYHMGVVINLVALQVLLGWLSGGWRLGYVLAVA
jgi:hypothetical protein